MDDFAFAFGQHVHVVAGAAAAHGGNEDRSPAAASWAADICGREAPQLDMETGFEALAIGSPL